MQEVYLMGTEVKLFDSPDRWNIHDDDETWRALLP
nr:MAG TPA: hypothetical protein [Caudoviricetes sp.]